MCSLMRRNISWMPLTEDWKKCKMGFPENIHESFWRRNFLRLMMCCVLCRILFWEAPHRPVCGARGVSEMSKECLLKAWIKRRGFLLLQCGILRYHWKLYVHLRGMCKVWYASVLCKLFGRGDELSETACRSARSVQNTILLCVLQAVGKKLRWKWLISACIVCTSALACVRLCLCVLSCMCVTGWLKDFLPKNTYRMCMCVRKVEGGRRADTCVRACSVRSGRIIGFGWVWHVSCRSVCVCGIFVGLHDCLHVYVCLIACVRGAFISCTSHMWTLPVLFLT